MTCCWRAFPELGGSLRTLHYRVLCAGLWVFELGSPRRELPTQGHPSPLWEVCGEAAPGASVHCSNVSVCVCVCVCQSAQLFKKCIIISCIWFDLLPINSHFNTEYWFLKFLHLTEMLKTSHLCSMLSRDNGVVGFKHQIRKCFGLKCLFCRHKHSMRCPDFPSNAAGNVPLKLSGGFKLPSVETWASRLWLHHHLLHLPVWRSVNKHVMWIWLNTCCRNVNMVNMTRTKVNIFTETLAANILSAMGLWSIISIHWGSCFLYKPSFNPFFSQLKIQKNIWLCSFSLSVRCRVGSSLSWALFGWIRSPAVAENDAE